MNTVKVKRAELLAKLEANRESHRALFLKAQEGYRRIVIDELDKSLKDAREGRALRVFINLQAPQDHTGDYDTVIEMLRMSVDDVIEIEQLHFQCYVLDKWTWAAQANFLNSTYASGSSVPNR